ncbi:alpha/beta hydrolase [Bifidobacterium simiarum]|nr:alpha/beta hydrolase [Bifidobacterium simiarum]
MRKLRRMMTIGVTTLVLLVVFALLGQAMAPSWKVEPFEDHIALGSSDVAVKANRPVAVHEGAYRVRTVNLTVTTGDGTRIRAVLREPVNAPADRSACLFIHGSGTGSAHDFADIASSMASAGITTLVPEKRLDDYSWIHRDYARFADDYGRALTLLRSRHGVDPARTGLYAESEGTWIATLMTDRDEHIGFAILSSAPVVSGRQLMAMAASAYLQRAGAPSSVSDNVAKLMSMDFAPFDLRYGDFDARRYLPSLTMPVLVNYGVLDTAMPIEQGAETIIAAAHRSGNDNVTVRYFRANHQMRAGEGLFTPGLPLADGYTHTLDDWVNAVAAGTKADGWATARIAGVTPDQRFTAPRWTSSGLIGSLGLLCAMTVAAVLAPLLAAVAALALAVGKRFGTRRSGTRRSDTRRAGSRRGRFDAGLARLLVVSGTVPTLIVLMLHAYLGFVGWSAVMLHDRTTLLAFGWAALRIAALGNMVFVAWLIVRCRDELRRRGTDAADRGADPHDAGSSGDVPSPAIVGPGHWLTAALVVVGALLSLAVMAFWGLFGL